jgi:prephenate dehydrogenase
MDSVAIIGVGLIGGSFGLALREAGFRGRIVGVSSPQTIEAAIARGVVDSGVPLEQAAAESDLLYLAQPISTILETIERLGPLVRPNCLVTDAGSTKVQIVAKAASVLGQDRFLGGHPMAGKESRGVGVATPDLFRGRPYAVTPTDDSHLNTPAVSALLSLIERCGAHIVVVSPDDHDRAVGFTSHLPQMASTALSACLSDRLHSDDLLRLAGPGLSDMSRLSLSSYEIWKDIVETNSENIEHALTVYIDKLTELRDNLQTHSLGDVFATAAGIAQRIRQQNNNRGQV